MRKVIALCLMLCCMFSLCACSKDEIVEQHNEALQAVGDNNLTDNKDLQGTRELGEDSYVGTYQADYDDFTGKEIVFRRYIIRAMQEMKSIFPVICKLQTEQ